MSLFEDLVEELKESNLLEETVIDSENRNSANQHTNAFSVSGVENKVVEAETENPERTDQVQKDKNAEQSEASENIDELAGNLPDRAEDAEPPLDIAEEVEVQSDATEEVEVRGDVTEEVDPQLKNDKTDAPGEDVRKSEEITIPNDKPVILNEPRERVVRVRPAQPELVKKAAEEKEFYRRRALEEVNGLQMVEQVLAGVEREQLKTISKSYDDLEVKQALHDFLQVAEDIKSPQHAQAEFRLMQETEDWYSALSRRDRNISVAHLRRYCESTKPSLSSQALVALARFYRNSPYSESVRGKFDLVVTRLFTREVDNDKRELVFHANELIKHIQDLYAEWSSVPLYSMDEDDSELLISALKFQDFMNEAEHSETFDELVKKDFFNRLKFFKEKTNENFFSPILVAAAVESNVAVGNKYVELLEKERENSNVSNLTNKYGIVHDKSISEATSKTLDLLEILKEKKSDNVAEEDNPETADSDDWVIEADKLETPRAGLFKTNKKLIIATLITVIIGVLYFLMGGYETINQGTEKVSRDAKVVNLENSSLKEYVGSAKISEKTLYGITTEAWDKLPLSEKKEIVGRFLKTGEGKGYEKVHFLNRKGISVASATADEIKIVE